MRQFKNGQRVYWNDPAGETSGIYTVLDAHEEYYKDYTSEDVEEFDDRIILIGDCGSEAEVNAEELDILCPLSTGEIQYIGVLQDRIKELKAELLRRMRDTVSQYEDGRLEHPEHWSFCFHDEDGDKCEICAFESAEDELTVELDYAETGIERHVLAKDLDVIELFEVMCKMLEA